MQNKKVLVVDDEQDFVSFLEAILEEQGLDVITANDGEAGLKKAKSESPDLVLLDVQMPKIGGFDEEIRLGEDHNYVRKGVKFGKFGILKSSKIFVSPRRFKKEGWVKTYLKYFAAEVYMVFLGKIKSDIFKYKFNHYLKKPKNRLR